MLATRTVVSCDPEVYDVVCNNVKFCTSATRSGSHVALYQHLHAELFVFVATVRNKTA